jgi:hypothetical protein
LLACDPEYYLALPLSSPAETISKSHPYSRGPALLIHVG